jgi:pre-60S factor REI1
MSNLRGEPSGIDQVPQAQTIGEPTEAEDEINDDDAGSDEDEEDIDKKLASFRRRILPSDCLFCHTRTTSIEDAVAHMSRHHSFFLPHREAITDMSGLLSYLGEKVVIGNLCLYCPNGGKEFGSVDAVRKHMIDKSHCKMAYGTEEDHAEVQEFYEGGKGDDDWEDVEAGSQDGHNVRMLSTLLIVGRNACTSLHL